METELLKQAERAGKRIDFLDEVGANGRIEDITSLLGTINQSLFDFNTSSTKIDLSELSPEQAAGFAAWLEARPHLQARLDVAFSQGQSVKAGLLMHRKQPEYSVWLTN